MFNDHTVQLMFSRCWPFMGLDFFAAMSSLKHNH